MRNGRKGGTRHKTIHSANDVFHVGCHPILYHYNGKGSAAKGWWRSSWWVALLPGKFVQRGSGQGDSCTILLDIHLEREKQSW